MDHGSFTHPEEAVMSFLDLEALKPLVCLGEHLFDRWLKRAASKVN